jgi:hypothetical protein
MATQAATTNLSTKLFKESELLKAFKETQVPGDGRCFLHAIAENLRRLGLQISVEHLREILGIRQLAWNQDDDRAGIGEDFEPMVLRLCDTFGVSVVLFTYDGENYFPYHKGNGTEVVYLKLKGRHYTALEPQFEKIFD